VMNSVDQSRIGAASGINNAIARVAGVLAIAVLGIVMVNAFGARLDSKLANFSLPPGTLLDIQAGEIKLAGLQLPASLNPIAGAAVRESVRESFVFGFRVIMLICAGLSAASAVAAWLLISDNGGAPG
jgi:hypothetical protein